MSNKNVLSSPSHIFCTDLIMYLSLNSILILYYFLEILCTAYVKETTTAINHIIIVMRRRRLSFTDHNIFIDGPLLSLGRYGMGVFYRECIKAYYVIFAKSWTLHFLLFILIYPKNVRSERTEIIL